MSLDDITAPFATVVSLIGLFKSGRDAAQGQNYMEFMAWLVETGHKELKDLIEANHITTVGIKAVLNQQQDQLAESLKRIDSAISAFSSTLSGFSDLSAGLRPESVLSAQAMHILRVLDASATGTLSTINLLGRLVLVTQEGQLDIQEHKFLEDDLRLLVTLKLLTQSTTPKGDRVFHYTRAAGDLVKMSQTSLGAVE